MVRLRDICKFLDKENIFYEFQGNPEDSIHGFSSLTYYAEGTMTWCKDSSYLPQEKRRYTLMVLGRNMEKEGSFLNSIVTDNPKKVFFSVLEEFFGKEEELPNVGRGTYVSDNVKLGSNVKIGHNCTLAGDITIGDNTVIYNNVTIINRVTIGSDCVIQSGTIIGHDDFAYTEDEEGKKTMIKHYGGVDIGDDVFIAAGCVINRGTIDNTVICKGSKIDANCQISHNVYIGKNSAIISGSRIYGSVRTGENVYIASATVKNQLTLGDNCVVGMGSVVLNNVEDNAVVVGAPAKRIR